METPPPQKKTSMGKYHQEKCGRGPLDDEEKNCQFLQQMEDYSENSLDPTELKLTSAIWVSNRLPIVFSPDIDQAGAY